MNKVVSTMIQSNFQIHKNNVRAKNEILEIERGKEIVISHHQLQYTALLERKQRKALNSQALSGTYRTALD